MNRNKEELIIAAMYKKVAIEGQCNQCGSRWCPNKDSCYDELD